MTVMYWLGAAAIFVVIEIITMGLTTIWFADKTVGIEVP